MDPTQIHTSYYCNMLFQHNHIMSFWLNFLQTISNVTPRKTNFTLVSTYQKGIERLNQLEKNIDVYSLRYPSLILQPGQLEIDEQINFLWRSPYNLSEYITSKFKPDIEFADLSIWVVNSRWKVTFDVFYLTESYPEIHNAIMHFYHFFKNKKFYRFDNMMQGNVFIPNSVVEQISTEYDDNLIELSPDIPYIVDNSINRQLYAIPYTISPLIRIISHSDGSNYLGDTELPSYRVNFSFEAWFGLPNYLIFRYNPSYDKYVLDLSVLETHDQPPEQGQIVTSLEYYRFRPDDNLLTMIVLSDFSDPVTITINKLFKISETDAIQINSIDELTFEQVKKENGLRFLIDSNNITIDEETADHIKVTITNVSPLDYIIEVLYNFGQG